MALVRNTTPLRFAVLAFLAGTAFAHDPFEITTDARVRPETLTLDVTMARSTALAVATEVKEAPTFETAEFEKHRPKFLAKAPTLLVVQAASGPLAPQHVEVGQSVEGDIQFHLTYPRPPGGPLRLEAPHLKLLDYGYGNMVRARGPNNESLGEKLLSASDNVLEIAIPAAVVTTTPNRPLRFGSAAIAVLIALALLRLFTRRRRADKVVTLLVLLGAASIFPFAARQKSPARDVAAAPTHVVAPSSAPGSAAPAIVAPGQSPLAREVALAEKLEALAATNRDAAAEWLLSLDETDRRRVVAAVLLDASRRPAQAVRLAQDFIRADPTGSSEHGYSLVWVLTRVGEFEAALDFVERQHTRSDETEDPNKWLQRLFTTWAERQPELAAARATQLVPESQRDEALRAVAAIWRQRDPAAFTAFLQRLPAGPERDALASME